LGQIVLFNIFAILICVISVFILIKIRNSDMEDFFRKTLSMFLYILLAAALFYLISVDSILFDSLKNLKK